MNQLEIPRVVITPRCTFKCEYCSGPKQKMKEATVDEWLKVLEKPEYKKIVFTGGEPFLYKGLLDIIEWLKKPVEIYTNLSVWDDDILETPDITLNISMNPETEWGDFVSRLTMLTKHDVPFSLHMVEEFAEPVYPIYQWTESSDQRDLPMNTEPHFCYIHRVIFGPDAKRYSCCARIGEMEVGEGRYDGTYCQNPICLPCDRFGLTEKVENETI